MALDKNSLTALYAKRASGYDFTANAYYLLGFREFAYRKEAIRALKLKRGDPPKAGSARDILRSFYPTIARSVQHFSGSK